MSQSAIARLYAVICLNGMVSKRTTLTRLSRLFSRIDGLKSVDLRLSLSIRECSGVHKIFFLDTAIKTPPSKRGGKFKRRRFLVTSTTGKLFHYTGKPLDLIIITRRPISTRTRHRLLHNYGEGFETMSVRFYIKDKRGSYLPKLKLDPGIFLMQQTEVR
jgi:hypothetical protein